MTAKEAIKLRNTNRWKKLSLQVRQENPTCNGYTCRIKRRIAKTTEVDHIVPVTQGGDFWKRSNLQALCTDCHDRKTRAERRRLEMPDFCRHGFPLGPKHKGWNCPYGCK